MIRTLFTGALLLLVWLGVVACCGSVACNCQDQNDDALFFRFDSTVPTARLATVYIRRTLVNDTARTPVADTARFLATAQNPRANDTLYIRTDKPFVQTNGRKLGAYRYEIFTLRNPNSTPRDTTRALNYRVNRIQLDGDYVGDGCCSCYNNTLKTFYLNNVLHDVTDPTDQDRPQYTLLPY